MKALARYSGELERASRRGFKELGDEFLMNGFLFARASFCGLRRTRVCRELVAAAVPHRSCAERECRIKGLQEYSR